MGKDSLGCSIGIATDIPDCQLPEIERRFRKPRVMLEEERHGDGENVGRFWEGKVGRGS